MSARRFAGVGLLRRPGVRWQTGGGAPSGPAYDADAQAYFDRVEGPSGDNESLEPEVKTAINDFVVGCKDDGIWDAIKASCILAGARTLDGALQPLVGTAPTNYNFVSGDYDRKTGLTGTGSEYLDTNRACNADPQNDQHVAVYTTTPESGASSYAYISGGASSFGASITEILHVSSQVYFRSRNIGGAAIGSPIPTSPAFLGVSRSASSNFGWRLGGTTTTQNTNSVTSSTLNVFVFSRSNATLLSRAEIAFYSVGESLDLSLLENRVTTLIADIASAIP